MSGIKLQKMTLSELIPLARQLPPNERLKLVRILVDELDQAAEDIAPLEAHKVYELYTPYASYGVAEPLLRLLRDSADDPE